MTARQIICPRCRYAMGDLEAGVGRYRSGENFARKCRANPVVADPLDCPSFRPAIDAATAELT